jgi:hypothetical protein
MRNHIWAVYFQVLYPVWAVVGILVAFNYGRYARKSWHDAGGSWAGVAGEWASVAWFVIWGCCRDCYSMVRYQTLPHEPPHEIRYTNGHLLRFFIMASFANAAIFGVILRNVDRSDWPLSQLIATAFAVNLAVVAGLGHLFLAWRLNPRRWRWTSFALVMTVPVVMALRLL